MRSRRTAIRVAAALLEAAPDDLVYAEGGVRVAALPNGASAWPRSWGRRPRRRPGRSRARAGPDGRFQADGDAIPFGATIAVVRIDRESGRVQLERLMAVDDCGTVVNPRSSTARSPAAWPRASAEALYERVVYDDDGHAPQRQPARLRRTDRSMVPNYELDLIETPSPLNPLGVKGVGESGCVSAPPAVVTPCSTRWRRSASATSHAADGRPHLAGDAGGGESKARGESSTPGSSRSC